MLLTLAKTVFGRPLLPVKAVYKSVMCQCSHLSRLTEQFVQLEGGSVTLSKDEPSGIAIIKMKHAGAKNAFSGKMMVDFHDCVAQLESWNCGRAVILLGADNTFCSGGHLQTIQSQISKGQGMCEYMQDATMRLANLPLVSVAAIAGHALGGGAELTTACDFRIMTDTAKLGFVQVRLNIAPGWGGCTRLVRILGKSQALQLLSSGKILTAGEAVRIGLVNDIVDSDGDLEEHVTQWLETNCIGNAEATRVIKQMVLASDGLVETESYAREKELFTQLWGGKAHMEALNKQLKHK